MYRDDNSLFISNFLITHSSFVDKEYPIHAHDGYSASLVLRGKHRIVVENEAFEVATGAVRVTHPYEQHAIEKSSWEHINIAIESKDIDSMAQKMGKSTPIFFDHLIRDDHLSKMILEVYQTYKTGNDSKLKKQVNELIKAMIIKYGREKDNKRSDERLIQTEITKARNYIQEHAHRSDLDLDEVARVAQVSKYHFIRLFKQVYGRTPYQYLQNTRIECVRKRLMEGSSLVEAALDCGFYDQSHMIKTYKKYYGHTPSRVRLVSSAMKE